MDTLHKKEIYKISSQIKKKYSKYYDTYSIAQRRTTEVNLVVSLCLPSLPPADMEATI